MHVLVQATVLMVLPEAIAVSKLPGYKGPQCVYTPRHGIGYSRLCSQLVAYGSGLPTIWLLDDNVQQCYKLDYSQSSSAQYREEALQRVSFGHVMRRLEDAVLSTSMVQSATCSLCTLLGT